MADRELFEELSINHLIYTANKYLNSHSITSIKVDSVEEIKGWFIFKRQEKIARIRICESLYILECLTSNFNFENFLESIVKPYVGKNYKIVYY